MCTTFAYFCPRSAPFGYSLVEKKHLLSIGQKVFPFNEIRPSSGINPSSMDEIAAAAGGFHFTFRRQPEYFMFAVRQTFRIERKQDISLKRPRGGANPSVKNANPSFLHPIDIKKVSFVYRARETFCVTRSFRNICGTHRSPCRSAAALLICKETGFMILLQKRGALQACRTQSITKSINWKKGDYNGK